MSLIERQVAERERRGVGVSTVERVRHAGEASLDINAGVQRVAQALLDQLRSRGIIQEHEYEAGERFRSDAYEAGAVWSGAMPLEAGEKHVRSQPPIFLRSEKAADAMKRHVAATERLAGGLLQVAEYVCLGQTGNTLTGLGRHFYGRCDDKTAQVTGRTLVKLALGILADHYQF